jgi:hypothetical protein
MDVDGAVLALVVEQSLGAQAVTLIGWTAEEIIAGDGQGLGIFRFTGDAQVGDESKEWSVILKVLPDDGAGLPSAWSLPRREPLAYNSGLLETLPDALSAPRCLRHARHGGRHHLWLEDLGNNDAAWSLGDYAHAARELGRFNGAYLQERPLPADDWLSRDWLRSWLAEGAAAIDELSRHGTKPLVRRVYPPALLTELADLWGRREHLLAALDRLPQVLCHYDAFRRNLFLRSGRLLAVDWAFVGVGPLGAEVAPLISASSAFVGIDRGRWDDLERAAVDAYVEGLADVGWQGPPEQPRFGFAASAALRYWPGVVRLVLPQLIDETTHSRAEAVLGIPFDQIVDLWADFVVWHARLAAEALGTVPHHS